MGDQERLPKVYETLHLSPSICIYSYNIYFNLNLVSLLCRKTFLKIKVLDFHFLKVYLENGLNLPQTSGVYGWKGVSD